MRAVREVRCVVREVSWVWRCWVVGGGVLRGWDDGGKLLGGWDDGGKSLGVWVFRRLTPLFDWEFARDCVSSRSLFISN